MAGIGFKLVRNDISPKLSKMVATARNPIRVLRAMGTTFMSITMGIFNDVSAAYRPIPWANKKDGTPSKLQKSGTLSRSFHLEVTDQRATVSNPVIYASTHQFGRTEGRGTPILPQPFFPVLDGKFTPAAKEKIGRSGERMLDSEIRYPNLSRYCLRLLK